MHSQLPFIWLVVTVVAISMCQPSAGAVPLDGWDGANCNNICSAPVATCNEPTLCGNKTASKGDSDYFMLDQIWMPQFCLDLGQGRDITITHPPNSICDSAAISTTLSIHGLWAQYYGGYPACCNSTTSKNVPIDPMLYLSSSKSVILSELNQQWADPVDVAVGDKGLCYMWNHEWQKHGVCGSWQTADDYWNTTMAIAQSLSKANSAFDTWGENNAKVSSAEIEALYPHTVNIVCSPLDATRFSSIRTCWKVANTEFEMIDCPFAGATCDSKQPIMVVSAP